MARNAEDLLRLVRELTERGVAVEFVKNKLTFTGGASDPMATLMLTMLAGFAAFERDLIRERLREAISLAKGEGGLQGSQACTEARGSQRATRASARGHSEGRSGSRLWNQP